ncbi:MAG: GntR family transcriptional regulator, partial [Firmicutes bacterium]|nr:GntR family transcriptional regulator [Bacillota bacterium]
YIQAVSPEEFIENLVYGLYFSPNAVDNLFEVRSTLELGLLARIWRSDATLEKLTKLLSERQRVLEEVAADQDSFDMDAFIAADIAFHQAFFECADNDTIAKLASVVDEFMLRSRAVSHVPERREQVLQEHRLVIEAIEKRDHVLAQHRLLDHFLWYRAFDIPEKSEVGTQAD